MRASMLLGSRDGAVRGYLGGGESLSEVGEEARIATEVSQ